MTNVMQRRMLDVLEQDASLTDRLLQDHLRDGKTPSYVQAYVYTAQFFGVAAAALATNQGVLYNIVMAGDSDFLITYVSQQVSNSTTQAIIPAPYGRLQVTDTSAQRPFYSLPTFISLIAGNSGFPYLLTEPKLMPANNTLGVQFYNDSTVGPITQDAQFCFGGYRIFY